MKPVLAQLRRIAYMLELDLLSRQSSLDVKTCSTCDCINPRGESVCAACKNQIDGSQRTQGDGDG